MLAFAADPPGAYPRYIVSGPVTAADLETLIHRCAEARPCSRRCVIDLDGADFTNLHYPEAAAVAHRAWRAQLPCTAMRAALVVRNDVALGICRMFQLLREDVADSWSIHPDVASAEAWLAGA